MEFKVISKHSSDLDQLACHWRHDYQGDNGKRWSSCGKADKDYMNENEREDKNKQPGTATKHLQNSYHNKWRGDSIKQRGSSKFAL